MLTLSVRAFVCAAGGLVAASAAQADPFWLYEGNALAPRGPGFFGGPIVSGGIQQLPNFRSTVSIYNFFQGPLRIANTFDPDLKGAQPGGVIGYIFQDGTFPKWLGQRVRVEFGGQAELLSGRKSSTNTTQEISGVTYAGIGGTTLLSTAFIGPNSYQEEFQFRREGYNVNLKIAADHSLGPNFVLTPALGIFGGRTLDHYSISHAFVNTASDLGARGQLNERVRTNETGIVLGATATWQFARGWAVQATGSAGAVWLHSRLTGDDCLILFLPRGTPCGPSAVNFHGSTVDTSSSTVGFRGTASLGVSADMRFAIATLSGFFRYDSRIPGVDNPQFASQTIFGGGASIPGGNAPARVRFAGGIAYGGFFRLVFPMPGL